MAARRLRNPDVAICTAGVPLHSGNAYSARLDLGGEGEIALQLGLGHANVQQCVGDAGECGDRFVST